MNRIPFDITRYQPLLDEHQPAFERFTEVLIAENRKVNLTRITDPQQIGIRHYLDSLAAMEFLDEQAAAAGRPLRIIDAGSGPGFPGLVLAVVRPDWHFVSLEATEKKVRFQEHLCQVLGLANVRVLHGRAEAIAHQGGYRHSFDAVTARALARLPVLAELTLGLVREGGLGLYWKSADSSDEIAQAENAVLRMGAQLESLATYTLADETGEPIQFAVVACRKTKPTPKKLPRVFGMIKKQPLTHPPQS